MKKDIKKALGCIRKADEDFGLIEAGDKIAVGVSGGKDSLLLLYALSLYRNFCPRSFTLEAVTVSLGLEPFDVSAVEKLCGAMEVPYTVVPTDIGKIVFDVRQEKNPCSLCANMRRGAVNNAALRAGCNKVALAHHSDDVIETFIMSLFYEGRLHTFSPKTYLSRAGLTVIRPFVYLPEQTIIAAVKDLVLPVVVSPCPACGTTNRQKTKELLAELSKTIPDAKEKLLRALANTEQYSLWEKEK